MSDLSNPNLTEGLSRERVPFLCHVVEKEEKEL